MADDIDELLDEVETYFCNGSSSPLKGSRNAKTSLSNSKVKNS